MQPWQQLGAAIGVGLLFGITNPLSRIGGVQASRRSQRSAGFTGTVAAYLSTPLFAVSQVLGIAGSVASAKLLGSAPLSLAVPATNGASLVSNTACDWLMSEPMNLRLVLPGVALVVAGIALCST
mmetsp:Transcript_3809/g.10952  ORF Transcript_3809/g.10952 Transcript_3809/m.10952 type:complete len:125 (+) Transcript_3809:239-613(+)